MSNRKCTIITWDYKEQPDWSCINDAINEHDSEFGEVLWPVIFVVETRTDQFAIVVGNESMTQQGAQKIYDNWCFSEEA